MNLVNRRNVGYGVSAMLCVMAVALAGSAAAATNCIQVTLSDTRALCVGQRSPLRIDVENTCLAPTPVELQFQMDQEPMRGLAVDNVPGSSTLSKRVVMRIPTTMSEGSHRLTVTSTDAKGQVSSMIANVTIAACPRL